MPIPYEGEQSVLRVLEMLQAKHGWTPDREHEGGPSSRCCARAPRSRSSRAGSSSSRAQWPRTMHEVCAELRVTCARSVRSRARWASAGSGSASIRSRGARTISWVPKQRYGIMREYLPDARRPRARHDAAHLHGAGELRLRRARTTRMRKMRVSPRPRADHDGHVRQQPVARGQAARGPDVPRARVARRRSRPHPASCRRCGSRARRSTTTSSGRSTCRCSCSSATAMRIANTGQTFRILLEGRLSGPQAQRRRLEDAPQHALPRGPPQEDHRDPRSRRADARRSSARCPRCGRASSTTPGRWPRPRRSSTGWTYDEVARAARRAPGRTVCAPCSAVAPCAEVAEKLVAIAEGGLERRACNDAQGQGRARAPRAPEERSSSKGLTPADVLLEGMEREADPLAAIAKRTALDWE